MNYLNIKRWKW